MNDIWVSSDWHLVNRDNNDTRHPFKSKEWLERMAKNYHTMIDSSDVFIFLGDLCDPDVVSNEEWSMISDIVKGIPGHRIMCKGNHDTLDNSYYYALGFDLVCDIGQADHMIFSHKPVRVNQDEVNIHAHLHFEKDTRLGYQHINVYQALVQNGEMIDKPILLQDLFDLASQQNHDAEPDWGTYQPEQSHFTDMQSCIDLRKSGLYIADLTEYFVYGPVDESAESAEAEDDSDDILDEVLFPDVASTKYWEADDDSAQKEEDAATYDDSKPVRKIQNKNDVIAEATYSKFSIDGINKTTTNGFKNISANIVDNDAVYTMTMLAEDILSDEIRINPEQIPKEEIRLIRDMDQLIARLAKFYQDAKTSIDYTKNASASFSLLYPVMIDGSTSKTFECIKKMLPEYCTNFDVANYVQSIMDQLYEVEQLMVEAFKMNAESAYIACAKDKAACVDPNQPKEIIKALKKYVDSKDQSDIIVNIDSSGTAHLDYSAFGGGDVYIAKEVMHELDDKIYPSRFLVRSRIYDIIIIAHGHPTVGPDWDMSRIVINGEKYTKVEQLSELIQQNPTAKVLLLICNEKGVVLNSAEFPENQVRYSMTKTIFESAAPMNISTKEVIQSAKVVLRVMMKRAKKYHKLIAAYNKIRLKLDTKKFSLHYIDGFPDTKPHREEITFKEANSRGIGTAMFANMDFQYNRILTGTIDLLDLLKDKYSDNIGLYEFAINTEDPHSFGRPNMYLLSTGFINPLAYTVSDVLYETVQDGLEDAIALIEAWGYDECETCNIRISSIAPEDRDTPELTIPYSNAYAMLEQALNETSKAKTNRNFEKVKRIVNSIPKEEHHWFYHGNTFKDSPYVKYRNVMYLPHTRGSVGGFIDVYTFDSDPDTGIVVIALQPQARGTGLAATLVQKAIEEVPALGIKKLIWRADTDNIASIKLAQKLGFADISDFKKNPDQYKFEMDLSNINESTKEYKNLNDIKPMDRDEKRKVADKYGLRVVGAESPGEKQEKDKTPEQRYNERREKQLSDLKKARKIKKRKAFIRKVKSHIPGMHESTVVDEPNVSDSDSGKENSPLYGEKNDFFYNYDYPKSVNSYAERLKLEESAQKRVNDEGVSVPETCPKCGAKIGLYLKGEPVWLCSNKECGAYYGTAPCNEAATKAPIEDNPITLNELKSLGIRDLRTFQRWLKNNVKYEEMKTLKTPRQVLESKRGCCHDQTNFEMEVLKLLGYQPRAYFVMEFKDRQGGETHSYVVIEDNKKLYWLENAWERYAGLNEIDRPTFIKQAHEERVWGNIEQYPDIEVVRFLAAPGDDLQTIVDKSINAKKDINETTRESSNNLIGKMTQSIKESYHFELEGNPVLFIEQDNLDESAKPVKKYPVYIVLVHSGTTVSKMIKNISHSEFSHAAISFDSSLDKMYSFARKDPRNPFVGGFRYESIGKGFYDQKEIPYAVYMVPCTETQIKRMKKRLNYFIQNQSKFKFDFSGLITNYLGIVNNPEHRWFCSRFVADILNAGAPKNKPYVAEPSLQDPDDFKHDAYAHFIISGDNLMKYDRKLADKRTRKILREEELVQEVQHESVVLDIDSISMYESTVLQYHLENLDESVVQDFIQYIKSFKLKFDSDGNIIIRRREYDQLDMHYRNSLRLIRAAEKAGDLSTVKDELCKLHYMINLITAQYLNTPTSPKSEKIKKEMADLRAVMTNVFGQHLKYVTTHDPQFNFNAYYNTTKYSQDVVVNKAAINAIGKTVATALL